MTRNFLENCRLIPVRKITNLAGNLSVIEGDNDIPFITKRVFYIYDIPAGESRGAHAHKNCQQFLIAVSGSFEVEIDDGVERKRICLNRPFEGFYIPAGIWAHELNFSAGAICLVLTSDKYDENDYIRDYSKYLKYVNIA